MDICAAAAARGGCQALASVPSATAPESPPLQRLTTRCTAPCGIYAGFHRGGRVWLANAMPSIPRESSPASPDSRRLHSDDHACVASAPCCARDRARIIQPTTSSKFTVRSRHRAGAQTRGKPEWRAVAAAVRVARGRVCIIPPFVVAAPAPASGGSIPRTPARQRRRTNRGGRQTTTLRSRYGLSTKHARISSALRAFETSSATRCLVPAVLGVLRDQRLVRHSPSRNALPEVIVLTVSAPCVTARLRFALQHHRHLPTSSIVLCTAGDSLRDLTTSVGSSPQLLPKLEAAPYIPILQRHLAMPPPRTLRLILGRAAVPLPVIAPCGHGAQQYILGLGSERSPAAGSRFDLQLCPRHLPSAHSLRGWTTTDRCRSVYGGRKWAARREWRQEGSERAGWTASSYAEDEDDEDRVLGPGHGKKLHTFVGMYDLSEAPAATSRLRSMRAGTSVGGGRNGCDRNVVLRPRGPMVLVLLSPHSSIGGCVTGGVSVLAATSCQSYRELLAVFIHFLITSFCETLRSPTGDSTPQRMLVSIFTSTSVPFFGWQLSYVTMVLIHDCGCAISRSSYSSTPQLVHAPPQPLLYNISSGSLHPAIRIA
ncbi:hypothetical protein C8R45DRAFT_1223468 [Mycena sanguinolenta]|nr:hypothetical protein C8R45DRAFT_1223468 [Mycena sanguinolenta]